MPVIGTLYELLKALPVTLVFDHLGRPEAGAGLHQLGFDALLSLVGSGKAYVKLSTPPRLSSQPDFEDLTPFARALVRENPERILWGTDWPHPGGGHAQLDIADVEPFDAIDDGKVLNRLADWAGDEATLHRILVDNPARLYGF